ncbi:MAG TPA: amidohydrolase family protein [Hyphomicrobiaceae bacterium]|jgi:predicted TIM-barrel fold metal-dependent hydrolase|nr:MAG: thioesterase [Pseudomonadota bacterium]HEX5599604.1 amidohydrolase family protein [Hyphomicrobiaceae bacterium]
MGAVQSAIETGAVDDSGLPIIDAHHHYWDLGLNRHPWLAPDVLIPFRYGDYSAIKTNFMPADYRAVSARHRIVASVTMEGEWDENDPVAETRWITEVAASHGTPAAHVARAFLHRADVEEVLAGHAAYPIVRGIRHKPTAAAAPGLIEAGAPGSMGDPAWRRGYAMLQEHGFHFELQAPWWHVDELLDLIAAYPETPVVINHTFLPADRSPEGLAGWRAALKRAASAPQVTIKISGIGLKGRPWSIDDNRPIIRETIEIFGPDRCMFASNFPVDGLCGSFDTIYSGYKQAVADLPTPDKLKLFHDNAIRIYRLAIPKLT